MPYVRFFFGEGVVGSFSSGLLAIWDGNDGGTGLAARCRVDFLGEETTTGSSFSGGSWVGVGARSRLPRLGSAGTFFTAAVGADDVDWAVLRVVRWRLEGDGDSPRSTLRRFCAVGLSIAGLSVSSSSALPVSDSSSIGGGIGFVGGLRDCFAGERTGGHKFFLAELRVANGAVALGGIMEMVVVV